MAILKNSKIILPKFGCLVIYDPTLGIKITRPLIDIIARLIPQTFLSIFPVWRFDPA
jgi:hypothetical protein